MADYSDFKNTVDTLFGGMESFMSSKTVVGESIRVGDTVILPLMDVTFGVGAGANQGAKDAQNAGGGIGGKMSPSAVLVISNGTTKLVSVKSQDGLAKILDMVPDMVNKFTGGKDNGESAGEAAKEE